MLQELECHGVIRFYHQDSSNNGKYATKCVRVSSSAYSEDVIDVLAEKFRSDMRMLTKPRYGLYEVHVDGGMCIRCFGFVELSFVAYISVFAFFKCYGNS